MTAPLKVISSAGSRLVSDTKTSLVSRSKELEDCIDKSIQRPPLCYQRPFSNTPKWDTRLKKCPVPNCGEYFCVDPCKSNMLNGPTCKQHKCQPAHNRAWWLANLYTLIDRLDLQLLGLLSLMQEYHLVTHLYIF